MDEMARFRELSAELGRDPLHVQGPGGNTSLKHGERTMWVKASGFELREARTAPMFVEVDFVRVREAIAQGLTDVLSGAWSGHGPRPSIETSLHALLPQRVVLHTHTVPLIAAACRIQARVELGQKLAGLDWAWVDYARPGLPLSRAVAEARERQPDASVLVLGNHGVVVGADDVDGAQDLLAEVTRRAQSPPRTVGLTAQLEVLERLADAQGLTLPALSTVHDLALHPDSCAVALGGSLYPDHVVFLGSAVGLLADRERYARGAPNTPKLWLSPEVGVLLEPGLPRAAQAMAVCLSDVVRLLPSADSCNYLSARDEAALLGMEEEKYRQSLAGSRS